jgi:GxxExxY protein
VHTGRGPRLVLPIVYEKVTWDVGHRIDPLVNGRVIVELKAVEKIVPLYDAQLISYLRLSGKKVGLLFNIGHRFGTQASFLLTRWTTRYDVEHE